MLLSVTGASGVGKSTALVALARAFAGQPVSCVDFDSVGVPVDADTAWRHRVVQHWVRRALVEQRVGGHLVLCGQVPVGELLAAPSADTLDGIACCLLHCSPDVRRVRLVNRGDDPASVHDHVVFGQWLYRHTLDPTYMPHVVRIASSVRMRWTHWADWTADDPRWSFEIIDTDALTPEQTATRVVTWARDVLAGRRPMLVAGWAASSSVERSSPS